jgi:hypothetical protein
MGMVPKYTNRNLRRTLELKTKRRHEAWAKPRNACGTREWGALAGAIQEAATVEVSLIAVL